MFEAGYLYKYKDIVWAPKLLHEDDDDESDEPSSLNDYESYYKNKPLSNSSRNHDKNKERLESFRLHPGSHSNSHRSI